MNGNAMLCTLDFDESGITSKPADRAPRRLHRNKRIAGAMKKQCRRSDVTKLLMWLEIENFIEQGSPKLESRRMRHRSLRGQLPPGVFVDVVGLPVRLITHEALFIVE